MSVLGIGRQNIKILLGNKEAAQFYFWEYINGNQTFIGFSPALHLQCRELHLLHPYTLHIAHPTCASIKLLVEKAMKICYQEANTT
jgi:hypothetical protein